MIVSTSDSSVLIKVDIPGYWRISYQKYFSLEATRTHLQAEPSQGIGHNFFKLRMENFTEQGFQLLPYGLLCPNRCEEKLDSGYFFYILLYDYNL